MHFEGSLETHMCDTDVRDHIIKTALGDLVFSSFFQSQINPKKQGQWQSIYGNTQNTTFDSWSRSLTSYRSSSSFNE